jgi:Mg2+ and Co2+ transporters
MLTITKSQATGLETYELANLPQGAWINLVAPTQTELAQVSDATEVPVDILRAALDEEERSRTELEDNCLLTVINVPIKTEKFYDTLPLGVILTETCVITVSLEDNDVLRKFNHRTWRFFNTSKKTRFLFQLMYETASLFLKDLQIITRQTDFLEQNLRQSMRNDDLFLMLDVQKSMTYFTYSLRANGVVMDKVMRFRSNSHLQHLIKMYEEDEDLLEDVIIENKQAQEMVEVQNNITSGMMDAFASIINNNVNQVMKFLACVTILMAIPTGIASFWGMNVLVPMQGVESVLPFWGIVALSLSIVSLIGYWLFKKGMF